MTPPEALRAALARLKPSERQALITRWGENAQAWASSSSALGAMWEALADLVAEVDRLEWARAAADGDERQPMREARRARK